MSRLQFRLKREQAWDGETTVDAPSSLAPASADPFGVDQRKGKASRWKPLTRMGAVLLFCLTLFALTAQATVLPVAAIGDTSFMIGMQIAVTEHMQWGKDIVWTYGPLGYLDFPVIAVGARWAESALVIGAFHLLFICVVAWLLVRTRAKWPWWLMTWMVIFVATELTFPLHTEIVFTTLIMSFLAMSGKVRDWWLPAVIGSLCAICVLIVISTTAFIVVVCLAFLILGLRRSRVMLAAPASAITTFLVLWIWSGQSLENIGVFMSTGASIVSGYPGAMSIDIVDLPLSNLITTFAIICWLAAAGMWLWAGGARTIFPCAAWAAAAFLLYKEGMVRHDDGHFFLMVASQILLLLLVALFIRADVQRRLGWPKLLAYFPAAGALVISGYFVWMFIAPAPALSLAVGWENFKQYGMATQLITDARVRHAAIGSNDSLLKSQFAIPQAMIDAIGRKTVSIWPVDIGIVQAYSLNWDPLPVLDAYAAYTTELDDMDARKLTGSTAPEFVLWRSMPLDSRNALDYEPAVTRMFMEEYRPVGGPMMGGEGSWILLQRKDDAPKPIVQLDTANAKVNSWIPVPRADGNHLVFARINISDSLHEDLAGLMARSGIVYLSLQTADGTILTFRLTPGNSADGVLMNSAATTEQFYALLNGQSIGKVVAMRLSAPAGCLKPDMTVGFFETSR